MLKIIAPAIFASALTVMGIAGATAADNTNDQLKLNDRGGVTNEPGGNTSDRTPNTASPDRGAGAGTTGAAGTDAAKVPEGTSDRTPPDSTKEKSMD